MKNWFILLAVASVTVLAYLPGLSGQFIFDDVTNFKSLQLWSEDLVGWESVVLDHPAGPLGRPLAMATFLANTALNGFDPLAFKLTNLLLHLVTGLSVYLVVRKLVLREPNLAPSADLAAVTITALWLLHPMMVSTVLYAVQRMAILAALFTLLAILAYLHGRSLLESGKTRHGATWIFAGVPILTALGALSKENALLAPMICAVIDLALYSSRSKARPKTVTIFLILGGLLPVLAAVTLFVVNPGFYLDGFENRPFTLLERLMTQGRVLFDYVGQLLLPRGPQMSLFRDDYLVSTGMLQPWTTLLAWLAWAGVLGTAWYARYNIPGFTAGIGIYLIGHAMESSIFPLLIYFEHRNYFPAVGLLFAIASLLGYTYRRFQASIPNINKLSYVSIAGIALVLSSATFSRASVWSSNEVLLTQSLQHYPDSRTLRMELAELSMNMNPPRLEVAQSHYSHLLKADRASTRIIGAAGLIASSCYADSEANLQLLARELNRPPETLEANVLSALTSVTLSTLDSSCKGAAPADLAALLSSVLDRIHLHPRSRNVSQLRFRVAQLYAAALMNREAISQLELALAADNWDPPIGLLMVRLQIAQGNFERARIVLEEVRARILASDLEGQRRLQMYRHQLEE